MPRTFSSDRAATREPLAFEAVVPKFAVVLDTSAVAVLSAPPGTGKTTLVPPLVANRVAGRVVVTQPRRVAAPAAARRIATLDGSRLGERVGYTVRGDRVLEPGARIEMVTPGVLLRRLLDDPGLEGVGAVIIDEIHERALETDLLLGVLGEVRELRDDLILIAMSATVDADRYAALLGTDVAPAPVITHAAEAHPLEVRWVPPPGPRMDDRGITPTYLRHVADTAAAAHRDLRRTTPDADALVFAPAARDVATIARHLRDLTADTDVLELHGQLPAAEQDRALAGREPGGRPRIVVTTAIAESSLTVPGVRLVIDTCLARVPRRDAARGMTGLVTVPAARASATQRAGRATRLGPGIVVRCVDERTFAAAPAFPTPEIRTADLTDAALLLACWGAPGGRGLRMPDPLPADALAQATATLTGLGAIDGDGRATDTGRRLARIPTDPRLGRALLDGAGLVGARTAAEVVAAISDDIRATDGDLGATVRALRDGRHPASRAWEREVKRFRRLAERGGGDASSRERQDDHRRVGTDGTGQHRASTSAGRAHHRAEADGRSAPAGSLAQRRCELT
ncbi:helicase-related protein [Microbacterium gorillae]|uniref:helicase-related protein n=1 Tax=Microbacterium gorillae TaxID=1231063 RepID=UPI0006948735